MLSIPSRYRRRSPFLFFAPLTKDELYAVDGFVDLAGEAWKSQMRKLISARLSLTVT